MSQRKTRQSGLELLRIIAMLLIVMHHYSVHGDYPFLTYENITPARVFLQFLLFFGRPACSIFVLISGFFLIETNDFRKHYKKLGSFCGEIMFYGVAFLVLAIILGIHVGKKEIGCSIFPFATPYWFALYYLALYLFVPFINPMLKSLSRRRYTQLVVLIFICWSVLPSLNFFSDLFIPVWTFDSSVFFLVMYIFGAYIRLHIHGKVHYDNRWNLAVALGTTLLLLLSTLAIDFLAWKLHKTHLFGKVTRMRELDFPLCVVWAVALFLYFVNLNFKSAAVNRIGATTFGIYLIHEHPLMIKLLGEKISPNINYINFPYYHALIKILAVFFICIAIELLREATIGRWFDRFFAWAYDRAFEKLDARRLRKSKQIQ